MIKYFYDTYALIEYINENRKYKRFFAESMGITTKMNLMELYYALLKDVGKDKAEIAYDSLLSITTEVGDETIKKAMKLRLELKSQKKSVSYVDTIGYQISLELGIKFLTGDREFKNMKNVEFVK